MIDPKGWWMRLDIEPVKFSPADVRGGAQGGGGGEMAPAAGLHRRGYTVGKQLGDTSSTRGSMGRSVPAAAVLKGSPFQPGGAGSDKPKTTTAQRLAKNNPSAPTFK